MNKIGFKNFRRFLNFQPIELKGITFLVGRNNAGKSSLVKALLLVNNFLKTNQVKNFSFGNNVLEDANIVTFGRAKNRQATEDVIEFYYADSRFELTITISGNENQTVADVQQIRIKSIDTQLNFDFNTANDNISISKTKTQTKDISDLTIENLLLLNTEIQRLTAEVEKSNLKKTSKEYVDLIEELNSIKRKRNLIAHSSVEDIKVNLYSVSTNFESNWTAKEIVDFLIREARFFHDQEFKKIQNGAVPTKNFEDYRGFKQEALLVEKTFSEFVDSIGKSTTVYLGANPAKQSALFPIRDSNNALAQAIHEFFQLRIAPGEVAYEFVLKWMKEFEVGDQFSINIHAGEAYEVIVQSHGVEIHLADKGMGSIQAMLLLLRLATIIHKSRKDNNSYTVIIEEPELNLHPALQSKLAELFVDVYVHDIWLIIETHSEYLIRKSQVIVANDDLANGINDNPFCVYYFPKDIEHQPYRMEYNTDGSFKQNFGEGFFDAASSSTLELIKLKRQKHA